MATVGNENWFQNLGNPTFDVSLIRRYAPQETRKKQFEVEEIFADYLQTQAIATPNPAPGLNVTQPRFYMQGSKARLQVSDNTAALNMSFASKPGSGLRKPIHKAALLMDKLDQVFPDQRRFFCALVVSMNLPAVDQDEVFVAVKKLVDQLVRPAIVRPEIFNFTVASREGDLLRLVEVSQFVGAFVEATAGQNLIVDLDFTSPTEQGVGIKLEVNSKPSRESGAPKLMSTLVDEMEDLIGSNMSKALGYSLEELW